MKKKLILLFVFCIFINIVQINADEKVTTKPGTAYDSVDSGITYYTDGYAPDPLKAGGAATVEFSDGKMGYCIESGASVPRKTTSCTKTTYSGDDASLYAYILSSGKSRDVIGLAVRTASYYKGLTRSSSDDKINCAYIKTLYNAANDKNKTYLVTKYPSFLGKDASCLNKDIKPNSAYTVGKEAQDLLSAAMSSSETKVKTHTFTETKSDGKVTFTVTIPEGVNDAKLNISCPNCSGAGEKTIKGGDTATFTIESSGKNAGSCGDYTATLTYTGNGGNCSKVVKYDCGDYQDFVACDKTTGEDGKVTDNKAGTIPCSEEDCPVKPGSMDLTGLNDAEGLCTEDGETVLYVKEEEQYTANDDYIDACVIEGTDVNGESLKATGILLGDNPYCEIYCTENYEFYTPGGLSGLDYDDATGDYFITSGSYFNFEKSTVQDKTEVSCYGKNNMDLLMNDIVILADEYAKKLKKETNTCSCVKQTAEDGTETTTCTKSTYTTTYSAQRDGNSMKVKITEFTNPLPDKTTVSSCTGVEGTHNVYSDSEIASAKNKYIDGTATVDGANDLIKMYESCNNWNFEKLEEQVKGGCHAEVLYNYTDGLWLGLTDGISSKELKLEGEPKFESTTIKTYKSGDAYSSSNPSNSQISINLGDGVGISTEKLTDANYTYGSTTITNTYKLEAIGICNDYNSGTSTYVSDCNSCNGKGQTCTTGWPVDYETPQGKYEYEFIVDKYGHYLDGDTCEPGRLAGVAYTANGFDDVDLVCPYKVNGCDDCEWGCDPDGNCEGNDDCDDECIWECKSVGCLFDINSGLAINYSPISLINLFNEQSIAYLNNIHKNAIALAITEEPIKEEKDADSSIVTGELAAVTDAEKEGIAQNWANSKGLKARDAIKTAGEDIYNKNDSSKYGLEYAITLTPNLINKIRQYNDEQEKIVDGKSMGGYLNSSLSCKQDTDYNGNKNDDFVTCTSNFLRDYLPKHGVTTTNDKMAVLTENMLLIPADDKDLFEAYGEKVGDKLTIKRKSMIGPAWK